MKPLVSIFMIFAVAVSQAQEPGNSAHYDFSSLWVSQKDRPVYGFVGENYHRLWITIDSVAKDKNEPSVYHVKGRSQVGSSFWTFRGTITVTDIHILEQMHFGVDDEYKNNGIQKQGTLTASYYFDEDKTDPQAGVFEGTLTSSWDIDKYGKLQYDDIERHSDSYRNNQFEGTWTSRDGRRIVNCNWGDFRISNSGDLDVGAGEFSPAEKYVQYGWSKEKNKISVPCRRL